MNEAWTPWSRHGVTKMEGKEFWGWLTVILSIVGYIPYLWDTLARRTKPHIFSWLVWAIVTGIAFIAQLNRGAGPGAWFTGTTCLACLIIAGLALPYGEKRITRADVLSFFSALTIIPIWAATRDPLIAVILASLIDILGTVPTLRKTWLRPHEETLSMWVLATIRPLLSLLAIQSFSLTTVLFPVTLALENGLITMIIVSQRSRLLSAPRRIDP